MKNSYLLIAGLQIGTKKYELFYLRFFQLKLERGMSHDQKCCSCSYVNCFEIHIPNNFKFNFCFSFYAESKCDMAKSLLVPHLLSAPGRNKL